jgi:hypothetical protein
MPTATGGSSGVFDGLVFELELPRDSKKRVQDAISKNGGKFSFTISRKVYLPTFSFPILSSCSSSLLSTFLSYLRREQVEGKGPITQGTSRSPSFFSSSPQLGVCIIRSTVSRNGGILLVIRPFSPFPDHFPILAAPLCASKQEIKISFTSILTDVYFFALKKVISCSEKGEISSQL